MENVSPAIAAEATLLLDTLQGFSTPVAFSPLWDKLKQREGHPKEARAKELLPVLVKAGLIRRAGKGTRLFYWLPALEPSAHERLCAALTDGPRSKADLKTLLPGLLPGWPPAQREAMLRLLVQTGQVHQWPPLKGNTSLFSMQPPNPQLYLQKPVRELAGKLQRLAQQFASFGIAPEQVYELAQQLLQQSLPRNTVAVEPPSDKALPIEPSSLESAVIEAVPIEPPTIEPPVIAVPSNDQLILEGMQQFTGSPLVSLTELRRNLAAALPDKAAFDQTVLLLARQGRVVLHRHDYPSSLNPTEQAELVNDEHGNYFIGIALND